MKRSESILRKIILAGMVFIAFPLAATACPQPGEDNGRDDSMPCKNEMRMVHHFGHDGEEFPFPPGLDLTESQRDKLFSIKHAQEQLLYEQEKIVRNSHIDLHKLATSDQYDDNKAKEITEKLGKALGTIALIHAQKHHQIFALLTPEQRNLLSSHQFGRPEGHHMFPNGAAGEKSGMPPNP